MGFICLVFLVLGANLYDLGGHIALATVFIVISVVIFLGLLAGD